VPEPLDLLFIDPKSAPRIRKRPAWSALLEEFRRAGAPTEADAPPLPGPKIPAEDRAEVFVILARGAPTDTTGVTHALAESIRDDGKRATPMVLVAGDLTFPFEELAELKATVTAATPFSGGDEPLEAALGAAKDFLQTPGLLAAPAVVESLTTRLREAFRRTKRAVPPDYVKTQADRALLEQRRYQQRIFQGAPHVRALLTGSDRQSMLVYLPAAAAPNLPLSPSFAARLVAEAHPAADLLETHPFSLRALALARVIVAPQKAAPAR